MKRLAVLLIITLAVSSGWAEAFKVSSRSLEEGKTINTKHIYNSFGCSGANKSPELSWSKGPEGTKFYAVTMYDPDAPTGSGWWHWTLVNIPSSVTQLKEGASGNPLLLPTGALEAGTDFGKPGYGGPCPPVGDKAHRYVFKVFALKDKVPVEKTAPGAMVGFYVNSLKLAEATLTPVFGR